MAKNSNFNIAINLLTEGLQKGVNTVNRYLNSLKKTVVGVAASLGAGIGLGKLTSSMVDSAKAINQANIALKNVSKTTNEYIELQNWLDIIGRKYKQNIVDLTNSFTSFHSAADHTNMKLEDQKKVYEALTRAIAFFGMDAEQAKNSMIAVTQMMSKGKVTSEELRRQLGNNLPGAFGLMAKAIGVSTAELDKMMKAGNVIASDALPKFADALNEVTKAGSFDTLNNALNDLKNNFNDLVKKLDIEGKYKGIINATNSLLRNIKNNVGTWLTGLISLVSGALGTKMYSTIKASGDKEIAQARAKYKRLQGEAAKYEAVVERYKTKIQKSYDTSLSHGGNMYNNQMQYAAAKEPASLAKYRDATTKIIAAQKELNTLTAKYGDIVSDGGKKIGVFGSLLRGVKNIGAQVGATLKAAFSAVWFTAVITAITTVISKLIATGKELKAIKGLEDELSNATQSNIQERANETQDLTNAVKRLQEARANGQSYDNEKADLKTINSYVEKYNELIKGKAKLQEKNVSKLQEYNDKTSETIIAKAKELGISQEMYMIQNNILLSQASMKTPLNDIATIQATILAYNRLQYEYEFKKANQVERQKNMLADIESISAKRTYNGNYNGKGSLSWKDFKANLQKQYNEGAIGIEEYINQFVQGTKDYGVAQGNSRGSVALKRLQENLRIYQQTNKGLSNLEETLGGDVSKLLEVLTDTSSGSNEGYEKALEKYKAKIKTLNEKNLAGMLNGDEYVKELRQIQEQFLDAVADAGVKLDANEFVKAIAEDYSLGKIFSELAEQAEDDIKAGSKQLEEAIKSAFKDNDEQIQKILDYKSPKLGKRDKWDVAMDYNRADSEVLEKDLDIYSQYLDDIKEQIKDIGTASSDLTSILNARLEETEAHIDTIKGQIAIAKIKEDLQDLQKEMGKGVYSGIKDIADVADRLVKGFENVKETMEDPDSTAWEKILSIFNQLIQVIETFVDVVNTFKTLKETMEGINKATQALSTATQLAAAGEQALGSASQTAASEQAGAAAEAVGAKITEAGTVIAASESEAQAEATKSGAALPFPFNLAAIAAGVAAVASIFAGLMKFEKGGIVGGNSYSGDNNLVRVNSGEMILTKSQQAGLWKAINNGSLAAGNVEFKIKGSDLVGTLNNYQRKMKG